MSKKKPFYVSLNRLELDLLADATYEEATLYVTILKRLANFKTGLIGTFQKEPLTYEALAVSLSRPSSQGKPAETITRDRARDLVKRLESRGLVSNVQVLGKSLVMLLPLSPIDYGNEREKEPTTKAKPDAGLGEKLRQSELAEQVTDSQSAWFSRELDGGLSVLKNTTQSPSTINPPQERSNDLREEAQGSNEGEQAEYSDLWSEPLAKVNIGNGIADANTDGASAPSIAHEGDIHPPSLEGSSLFEAQLLTVKVISKILSEHGILHADTTISRGLYLRWIRAGITHQRLLDAVDTVNVDRGKQQTPHSVDSVLFRQWTGVNTTKGKVAL